MLKLVTGRTTKVAKDKSVKFKYDVPHLEMSGMHVCIRGFRRVRKDFR